MLHLIFIMCMKIFYSICLEMMSNPILALLRVSCSYHHCLHLLYHSKNESNLKHPVISAVMICSQQMNQRKRTHQILTKSLDRLELLIYLLAIVIKDVQSARKTMMTSLSSESFKYNSL